MALPVSGEDLLYTMEAGTAADDSQGWAESVQMEDSGSSASPEGSWDSFTDAGPDDMSSAASAMDLVPDTSGIVTMTEGASTGLEGLEQIDA